MAGVAGAKNLFQTGVLIGNWNEDTWGKDLVGTLARAAPSVRVSEAREAYTGAHTHAARPAVRGFDALDPRLVMAHGTKIVEKHDASEQYISVSAAVQMGTPVSHVLEGRVPAPHTLARTDAIRRKGVHNAACVDRWDPATDAMPQIPMTVTPKAVASTPATALHVSGAAGPSAYASVARSTLETAAVLRETVQPSSIGTDKPHGRSLAFTRGFERGISGLRQ